MTTTTLDEAANIAERLVFGLRQTALNDSFVSLADLSLRDLVELLPVLQETLRDIYRRHQTERITQAAGNATSHTWALDEHDLIRCPVCGCGPVGYLLATGSVPLCTPDPDCRHNLYGIRADQGPHGSAECISCNTVYPPTAGQVTA